LSISSYFDAEDLEMLEDVSDIVKYREHPAFDAVPFVGSIKKHPYDKEKFLILLLHEQKNMAWFKEGEIIEVRPAMCRLWKSFPQPLTSTVLRSAHFVYG